MQFFKIGSKRANQPEQNYTNITSSKQFRYSLSSWDFPIVAGNGQRNEYCQILLMLATRKYYL